jgi:hypothetical protein
VKTALKSFKIKDIAAQNVDDAVRILRNAHSTLKAAGSEPKKFHLQLFDILQTSTNPEFNSIFEHWKREAIVSDDTVDVETIFTRATEVYQTLLDKKAWISGSKKSALILNIGSDEDSDSEDEKPSKSDRKKSAERAAAAALQPPGPRPNPRGGPNPRGSRRNAGPPTPGVERIRTFRIDGTEVSGDVSPPLPDAIQRPREFKKTDNSGTIELWWCTTCGRGNGMWKHHSTANCPHQQANAANDDDSATHNVRFQGDTPSTNETASLAILRPPASRHIS